MAVIPTVAPSRNAGVDWADSSAIWTTATMAGDTFSPSPATFLFVRSTNPGNVTVTVMQAGGSSGPAGTFVAPQAMAPVVGASGRRVYGPFPQNPFADTSDGLVHVTYTTVSGGALGVYVAAVNFSAA